MNKVLIVDDDAKVRAVLCATVKKYSFTPIDASNGLEALEVFRKEKPQAVLLDLKMPGMDGMQTMQELKKIDDRVPVIIVTAHGDIPQAVEAIKQGAYDFISKPPDFNKLMVILKRATESFTLQQKVEDLHAEVVLSLEYLLGKSSSIRPVIAQVQQIARTGLSCILQGETGTGKTYIARTIHNLSPRAKGPFVSVDIGAIPETLVESELFGHEKGAFTGADRSKTGYFEEAQGGTLFIDELQNLTPHVQSKLLAAVDEKRIHPVGSSRNIDLDVRIITAANVDIREAVKEQRFRKDLFFRLGEFLITLPPLRERMEDIAQLAQKFMLEAADDQNKPMPELSEDALALLRTSAWPGNIRELKSVIRRAVLLCEDRIITPHHLLFLIDGTTAGNIVMPERNGSALPCLSLVELEKLAIKTALNVSGGNKTKAAALLAIDYRTLLRKLKTDH